MRRALLAVFLVVGFVGWIWAQAPKLSPIMTAAVTAFNSLTFFGTQTMQDTTASTGSTLLNLKEGAGQGNNNLLQMTDSTGVVKMAYHLQPSGYGRRLEFFDGSGVKQLTLGGANGNIIEGSSLFQIVWNSVGGAYNSLDLGLERSATGVLGINSGTAGAGGGLKIPGLKSTTGTRFACFDSTGLVVSSATACSGT